MSYLKRLGKADLHIHSNYSDAKMSVSDILNYAENKTDLDIIAITDHNTISGAQNAQKIALEKNLRVKVIVGEEISCREGHIVALFLKKEIPKGLSLDEAIMRIKKQGGLAIAPHPFFRTPLKEDHTILMNGIGLEKLLKFKTKFDAVEIANANLVLGKSNLKAQLFNHLFIRQSELGSSDAHIVEAIGKSFTAFEGKSLIRLKNALKNHQTVACSNRWKMVNLFKYGFLFLPTTLMLFSRMLNRNFVDSIFKISAVTHLFTLFLLRQFKNLAVLYRYNRLKFAAASFLFLIFAIIAIFSPNAKFQLDRSTDYLQGIGANIIKVHAASGLAKVKHAEIYINPLDNEMAILIGILLFLIIISLNPEPLNGLGQDALAGPKRITLMLEKNPRNRHIQKILKLLKQENVKGVAYHRCLTLPFTNRRKVTQLISVDEAGWRLILWDMEKSPKNLKPEVLAEKVLDNIRFNSILVLHPGLDENHQSLEALKIIIQELKKQGYQFTHSADFISFNPFKTAESLNS
ncbi:MAG: PHP domain-containing protein [Patescibacteria group bacterium]|jgi:hypothetical protein